MHSLYACILFMHAFSLFMAELQDKWLCICNACSAVCAMHALYVQCIICIRRERKRASERVSDRARESLLGTVLHNGSALGMACSNTSLPSRFAELYALGTNYELIYSTQRNLLIRHCIASPSRLESPQATLSPSARRRRERSSSAILGVASEEPERGRAKCQKK